MSCSVLTIPTVPRFLGAVACCRERLSTVMAGVMPLCVLLLSVVPPLQPDSSAPHKGADDIMTKQIKALLSDMDKVSGK